MRAEGAVVDAVSLGEIERSLAAGFRPEGEPAGIVFTADLIDHATMAAVIRHGIPVNAGSLDMLERVGQQAPGHRVWLRINPGFGHGHSNKTNTGGPQSKHGIWIDDVAQAIAIVRRHGLKLMGIHMHIGSGVDYGHLSSVCDAMVDVVRNLGHDIEASRRRRPVHSVQGWRSAYRLRPLLRAVGRRAQAHRTAPGPSGPTGDRAGPLPGGRVRRADRRGACDQPTPGP